MTDLSAQKPKGWCGSDARIGNPRACEASYVTVGAGPGWVKVQRCEHNGRRCFQESHATFECKVPLPPPSPHPPPPPSPPSPLPSRPPNIPPPDRMVTAKINRRFAAATGPFAHKPQLEHLGVLLHQFDGWELPGKPWSPCPKGAAGLCADAAYRARRERVSCTLIFKGLKDGAETPRDVIGVYSFAGGVVLRPTRTKVACGYGEDGAIDYGGQNCLKGQGDCLPGCGNPPEWCTRDTLMRGWCRCSFAWCHGRPNPWMPEDLGFLLDQQARYGSHFEGFGKYKGYNEIVVDADHWVARVPGIIEAFFFVACGSWGDKEGVTKPSSQLPDIAGGYGDTGRTCEEAEGYVRKAHAAFEQEHGFRAAPLLRLDLSNWDAPFTEVA